MKSTIDLHPQCQDVLGELKRGRRTTLQLMNATGAIRIGAVIHTLRLAGFKILTEIIRVPTRYKNRSAFVARYTLTQRKRRAAAKRKRRRAA